MTRIIVTYGLVSGAVIILGMIATIVFNGGAPHSNVWLGYLIMLVALSAILVGVKQHRDQNRGGVIRFVPAFLVGLGIAVAASLAYIVIWEVYLAVTDYSFMDQYVAATLEAKRAEGLSGGAYAAEVRKLQDMADAYENPLYRMPMTFAEIFPVGLLVAIVSAALLRNPRFLPAKARAAS